MMSDDDRKRLAEIEERERRATPGPFVVPAYDMAEVCRKKFTTIIWPCVQVNVGVYGTMQVVPETMGDVPLAEFVATSRADVPWLVGKLRESLAREKKLAKALQELLACCIPTGQDTRTDRAMKKAEKVLNDNPTPEARP